MSEKDYVLGTHDEELLRLGLQHRVWRPVVLGPIVCQRSGVIDQETRRCHAKRRNLYLSRIRSLWNLAFPSTDRESGKVSRARDSDLARVGRRTGWRCRTADVALAKWVYYSVGHAAYFLYASD